MVGLAFAYGIFMLIQRFFFGQLGTNVTRGVRQLLYRSVLCKNLGWFDDPTHATSVITSSLA